MSVDKNSQPSYRPSGLEGERSSRSDVGSIHPEIKALADQCLYPMSWLVKDYGNAAAYRDAVKEKAFSSPNPVLRKLYQDNAVR
jgi:hypothetical protein